MSPGLRVRNRAEQGGELGACVSHCRALSAGPSPSHWDMDLFTKDGNCDNCANCLSDELEFVKERETDQQVVNHLFLNVLLEKFSYKFYKSLIWITEQPALYSALAPLNIFDTIAGMIFKENLSQILGHLSVKPYKSILFHSE